MPLSCLRVFVADSQPVFRAGIVSTLCTEQGIAVVGDAGGTGALVDGIRTLAPHVAVVDGLLLNRHVMGQVDEVSTTSGTQLLVIAPPWSAPFVALLAGGLVRNCVLRASGRDELVQAVRKVGKGERHVHEAVDAYQRKGTPDTLTINELSVLALAAEGHSNVSIAGQLRVSLPYVNAQVRRLLRKLNARDRTHAVTLGLKHGLLEI